MMKGKITTTRILRNGKADYVHNYDEKAQCYYPMGSRGEFLGEIIAEQHRKILDKNPSFTRLETIVESE